MRQLTPSIARRRFKERLIFTLGLRRKPLNLFCEHCGKFIPSDMEWVCGYCNIKNTRTKRYSFLYKCERCKHPPKSFHCPHCDGIIFFDKKRDRKHPARNSHQQISEPTATEKAEQARAKKLHDREERKSELEYKIVCARLDTELATIKKHHEMLKKKSPAQALEQDFLEHDAHFMAVHKIAKRSLEVYEKEFASDPELLDMGKLSVKKWQEKFM